MKVPFNAAVVLLVICAGPLAFAQTTTPKKKKGAKPAASASASATEDAPPPPPPAPEPAPAASDSGKDASKDDSKAAAKASASTSAASGWDSSDTSEKPGQKYEFIGLRYRGTVIPQFFENLFVDDGGTVYSNAIGIEYERRTDGYSMIPWLTYTDYGMGDTLFLTKGKDQNDPTQYSVVNSGLKAIYLGIDMMWSTPLAEHWDFEYGFGVGIGAVFGDLHNDWVYGDANGKLVTSNGIHVSQCPNATVPTCDSGSHMNSTDNKTGNYVEKNWFNGGGVPVVFPHIAIPQLGIRYKPIKQLVARAQIGFQITGFYFQLSVDYGLEKPPADDSGSSGGDSTAPKKKKKAPDSDSTDSSGGDSKGDKN
jgi:hypothetical protein